MITFSQIDQKCQWCNESPSYKEKDGYVLRQTHYCPLKPPVTSEEGAAVAFGLMGMFEAIRSTFYFRIRACRYCKIASNSWVGTGEQELCWECWRDIHPKYRCDHEEPFIEHMRQFRPSGVSGFEIC